MGTVPIIMGSVPIISPLYPLYADRLYVPDVLGIFFDCPVA